MKNILIGGAWPYANGSLHIGHIAALLPGDILARYHRAIGDRVYYVSGSDCHGTPVTIRARQEGRSPQEISDAYHEEFTLVFNAFGFSYDLYTKTSSAQHKAFVREFHRILYAGEYVYEATVKQARCPRCAKVLTDRLIVGKCPACGAATRGDQCDACGEIPDADTIVDARCADCGSALDFGETTQLFLSISKLEYRLTDYLNAHKTWRKNAVAFTKRYIGEGLRDRAITRDLDWGIDVPKEGYGSKRIYIWAENVLGYLSASASVCANRGESWDALFGENARHYYVHGKDNIPFHTIILPSLLLGHGGGLRLPDEIVSSEYLTLDGRKISTSLNWAIWAKDIIDRYNPDALRYFFIANGPEKRDTDFSWREFVERSNSELLGAYGNFVNRSLVFIKKYYGGRVPDGVGGEVGNGVGGAEIQERIAAAYASVGAKIERTRFKDALDEIFELTRFGNQYFDTEQPWAAREKDPKKCAAALFNCVQIVANLAALLAPFLPFSSERVLGWLSQTAEWSIKRVAPGYELPEISILFERLDKSVVDEERARLSNRAAPHNQTETLGHDFRP
ncbi:MAG: methionine--tRNA ligase [Clostridiales bacterium]|nr:methionine--tRNA ligase [Clostridiales bacterium]